MIDINLVPENLRKKHKTAVIPTVTFNLPSEATIGLIGGLVVLLIIVDLSLLTITCKKIAQKKKLDKEWEELLPDKWKAERMSNELRSLQGKKTAMEKITKGQRILWAPKLNTISDSIPQGLWLHRIALEQGVLTIEGSAVSKIADEMMSVGNFTSHLKNQKYFVDRLQNLEVGSIQRRRIGAVEISDFSVIAKFQ